MPPCNLLWGPQPVTSWSLYWFLCNRSWQTLQLSSRKQKVYFHNANSFFFLFFRLWRNKKFKKLRLTVGLFMQTLVSHIKVDGLLTQPLPRSFHLFLLALLHERFTCYVPGIDIGIGHWRFVKYQCNWVALRNDFFRTKVIALPPCIICLT